MSEREQPNEWLQRSWTIIYGMFALHIVVGGIEGKRKKSAGGFGRVKFFFILTHVDESRSR